MALAAGLLTLSLFVVLDLLSVRGYMIFADEANILSIAAAWHNKQPMYHPVDSRDLCYSLMYGPLTFLVQVPLLVLGAGNYAVLKSVVALVNLGTCVALFSLLRKAVDGAAALCLTTFVLCALLANPSDSFGVRADPWVLLAMTLAVRCALIEAEIPAAILTGLAAGIGLGFKVTTAPAVLVVLLILYRRLGLRAATIAGVAAIVMVLAPFAVRGISLKNYVEWLLLTIHHGVDRALLLPSGAYLVFLVLPLLMAYWSGLNPWRRSKYTGFPAEQVLLAGCLIFSCLLAAKPGAGPWHFWQLLPLLVLYFGRAIQAESGTQASKARLDRLVAMVAVGSMLVALLNARRDFTVLSRPSASDVAILEKGEQEIAMYRAIYRGRPVEMGYGDAPAETSESLRYLLPLAGERFALDENTVDVEMVAGRRFPDGIAEQMSHCHDDVWLIPNGERPFAGGGDIFFPTALRMAFDDHYEKERTGSVFDAWVCHAQASSP